MFAYIMRRLGTLVVILFGSSFILYNLTAISGDPTEQYKFATDLRAKQELAGLIKQLDLNTPPPLRYFKWLKGILKAFTGNIDFGMTRSNEFVSTRLAQAVPTTLRLVLAATLIAIVLGIMLGVITALRQYSRFDYVVTFFSFLMFSLPIFWVAVLLKEFLAIKFNDFLAHAQIPIGWAVGLSLASGLFWAGIIGISRQTFYKVLGVAFAANFALLEFFSATKWFANPKLGPIVVFIFAIAIAYGVTAISTGLEDVKSLRASQTMAVVTLVLYYPVNYLFKHYSSLWLLIGLLIATLATAWASGTFWTKIDRGPARRTAMISAGLMGVIVVIDRLMQTWSSYVQMDGVNGRPIPTVGQADPLLSNPDFWTNFLDRSVHLFLPTIALTLISFAGYIRYSRGTLLEVLNQDYIRTARAKGLSERTVIMRHAFRNTMIPLTTIIVVDLAGVIGGAIITERVFGWSGMGTLFNAAIQGLDLNLLMGVFFCTATLSVLANLIADLLYSALDPRIRVGSK
jgi:peptide/nickel transport system permease protein